MFFWKKILGDNSFYLQRKVKSAQLSKNTYLFLEVVIALREKNIANYRLLKFINRDPRTLMKGK